MVEAASPHDPSIPFAPVVAGGRHGDRLVRAGGRRGTAAQALAAAVLFRAGRRRRRRRSPYEPLEPAEPDALGELWLRRPRHRDVGSRPAGRIAAAT